MEGLPEYPATSYLLFYETPTLIAYDIGEGLEYRDPGGSLGLSRRKTLTQCFVIYMTSKW